MSVNLSALTLAVWLPTVYVQPHPCRHLPGTISPAFPPDILSGKELPKQAVRLCIDLRARRRLAACAAYILTYCTPRFSLWR